MSNIIPFTYGTAEVRTVQQNGEPWFVLKDVCGVLEISNSRMAADRLEADEVSQTYIIDSLGRQQLTTVVNESGLYNVILRSDKPEAKPFRKWVTSEVLPTIRKTGGYVANEQAFVETYLPYADDATKALFSQTLGTIRQLNSKIEQDKPKVLFADAVSTAHTSILVGDLAKLIRQNGVDIGQNRLYEWLRKNNYLCASGDRYNMPTQRAMDMKLFEVKERTINEPNGSVRITRTTTVTGRGQQYFINKFLEQ